jgi:hypothetical protein
MLSEQLFCRRLDLDDADIIMKSDIETPIMEILKKLYIGKCIYQHFILDILKIIRTGLIEMSNKLDHLASIDVQFVAKVLTLEAGELILDAKVTNITENIIYMTSPKAYISVKYSTLLPFFSLENNFPIKVIDSRYFYGSDKITVRSKFFTVEEPKLNIYLVSKSSKINKSKQDIDVMLMMIDGIERELQELSKEKVNSEQIIPFFKDLCYPYKKLRAAEFNGKQIPLTKKDIYALMDEKNTTVDNGDLILRNPQMPKEIKEMTLLKNIDDKEKQRYGSVTKKATLNNIIILMLNDYYLHMNMILELSKHYKLTIKNYKDIWKYINNMKAD